MNSKTKNREDVSDLNTDPKSKLTDSDTEKADVLGIFFQSVFTIEHDGDIHHIPPVKLRHNMEELTIDEEMIKKTMITLMCVNRLGQLVFILGC